MNNERQTLILGVGNEILMDDGIGPRLVAELKKVLPARGICFSTISTGGMDLLDIIRDYQQVIIIDSIISGKKKPGHIFHFTPLDFNETLHLSSFHDTSFKTLLKLGDQLGIKVPERIDILAIEIVEDLVFGNGFSTEIQQVFDQISGEILLKVHELLK